MRAETSNRSIVGMVKDHVYADLGGEAIILNLENGVYYGLDPVGTRIWELIQEPKRVEAIRNIILDEYDVEFDRCEKDLASLLRELIKNGLAEIEDEAST